MQARSRPHFIAALILVAAFAGTAKEAVHARPLAARGFAPAMVADYLPATRAKWSAVGTQERQFVASTRGHVYYWVGCSAWGRLSKANLIYFRTAEEAQAAGYRPSVSRGCAGPGAARPNAEAPALRLHGDEPIAAAAGRKECTVARVIDGDTVECDGGTRVRLLLIDAPEMGQGAYGLVAKERLEGLLPRGAVARLELDLVSHDRYGRTLGYLYTGATFVNRELVRSGVAVVSIYVPNVRHVDLLQAASDSAKAERLGLWSGSAFDCLPADYRRQKCK